MKTYLLILFLAAVLVAACAGEKKVTPDVEVSGDTETAMDEDVVTDAVPDSDIIQQRMRFRGEQSWFGVLPTGQRKCYDNEKEIPCPKEGLPFFGQDSQFNQWKTRTFTPNPDGTVYDDATHLTWQAGYASGLTWDEAYSYCSSLTLAGKTWRLPTPHELKSLINYEKLEGTPPNEAPAHPATDFPAETPNDWFWATPCIHTDQAAWFVYFYDGYLDYTSRDNYYSVRCVATTE